MPPSKAEGPVDELFNSSQSKVDPTIKDTVKPGLIETNQPVPHQPVPSRNGISDYLARRGNNLAEEENPFDSQFGGGPPPKPTVAKTPGGSLLPSIHALQSGSAPGFMDGLRQGPLSPNMLAGPKEPPPTDYFTGEHGMGINDGPRVFTPNESALRHQTLPLPSGLASPGGSMFQGSLMSGMQSPGIFGVGVATPGTAEFNRTATEIRERQLATIAQQQKRDMNITSQPHQMNEENNNGLGEFVEDNQSNAAASLFMLANSASSRDTSPHHYNVPLGQSRQAHPSAQKQILNRNQQILNHQMNQQMNPGQVNGPMVGRSNTQPLMNGHGHGHSMDQRTRNNSINSNASSPMSNGNSIGYENEMNGHGGQSSGKKGGAGKRKTSSNKSTPKNNKRSKGNNSSAVKKEETKHEEFTNEDLDNMEDQDHADFEENEENNDRSKSKKPETDDEKRKSFLERNRVAALKCRQRKKQWLNNLQAKVDSYTTENELLQQRVQAMQNEIVQLRTMLVAHKDTPIGQQQGIATLIMGPLYEEQQHMHVQNPYGMAGMPPSQNPGMQ
ncbi:hypothetical protein MFRU_004g04020 [Monilinia fructicola]|nr:hypothetical protein MFRU_004g04020 [Monilinia fructicola]